MRLAELLCPLAAAADAGAALPPETAQRTALIALGLVRTFNPHDFIAAGDTCSITCSTTSW